MSRDVGLDLGLLILRLGAGLMLAGHGLGKAMDLFAGKHDFADPIGIGPLPSLILAVLVELGCTLLVAVGFKTRWAAIPVVIMMLVAAFVANAGRGWGQQEFPLLYAVAFLALAFTGAGKYSLDGRASRRRFPRRS